MGEEIAGATAKGIGSLFEINALVTVLVLVVLALLWLVKYLIQRNEKQGDKITDALIENTAIISEFKEMLRAIMVQRN